MRRIVDLVVLAALIAGVGLYWLYHPDQVRISIHQVERRILPCRSPITYSVGTIDSRFQTTKEKVISNLKSTEEMWETPAKRNLFEYREKGGDVTVNFVYDRRQENTDTLKVAGAQIDQRKELYDSLRGQYESLATLVKQERALYEKGVSDYESRESAYNATVASWNRRGGAPKDVFQQLQSEQQSLRESLNKAQELQTRLNTDIRTLNQLAASLNELIVQLNLHVQQYNQVGASLGEFEEGLYESSAGKQKIDIYEYSSHTALLRVLAHELGHALGLDHVPDPQAIMYEVNKGDRLSLAPDDIAALNAICSAGVF